MTASTAILFQTNMPESRQSKTSSINQLRGDVHVVNVGRARTMDWQQALYFSSYSPRLAMQASKAFPARWPLAQVNWPRGTGITPYGKRYKRQGGNGRHTRIFIFLSKYSTEKCHKEGQNNSFQRTVQLPIFKGRRIISMVSIRRHNTSWKHSLLFDDRAQPSAMCWCSSELNTTGEFDKMKDLRRIVMIDLYHFEL